MVNNELNDLEVVLDSSFAQDNSDLVLILGSCEVEDLDSIAALWDVDLLQEIFKVLSAENLDRCLLGKDELFLQA